MAAQNPEVIKAQAQAAATQQDQAFQMALEDKKIAGRIAAKTINTTHQAALESPNDRALSFAQRTADERTMQGSQFFSPVGG